MIDIEDFIVERGGNPDKIKESQKRRGASVELVDEIIEMWQDARRGTLRRIRVYSIEKAVLLTPLTSSI